jgi:ribosomal protein S18 acetylase RimI-like enzyme
VQRGILSQDVLDDVARRLRFYEEARGRGLPHIGAVFLAEDTQSGEIVGFADVGVSLYDTRQRSFRLPKRPEGEQRASEATYLRRRPYLSNLAVDERLRRRGVGRMLVRRCEEEARMWRTASASDGTASHTDGKDLWRVDAAGGGAASSGGDDSAGGYEHCWLEVSLDNAAAVQFYERLGYEFVAQTSGREIVRKRWSFESEYVKRGVMRRSLD